jgi:hypothetical protein
MRMRSALYATAVAIFGAAAAAQPAQAPADSAESPPPAAAALLQSCSAHKLETVVRYTTADGTRRQSKVKLCGTEGQTDAQWAVTLRDAATKAKANVAMAPEAREQVVAAIEAEIAKVEEAVAKAAFATTLTLPRQAAKSGAPGAAAASRDMLAEYSALPPLPNPTAAASAAASLPNLASTAAAGTIVTAVPSVPAPRVTISCMLASNFGAAAPCSTIESDTKVAIRADEDLPAGVRVRFLRRGSNRGEVALAAMKQGQTMQIRLPRKLCAGVLRSRTEIEIGRAGQNGSGVGVQKLGPYELRC